MTETMGQIIKRMRKERGLTQEELAELLNISAPAVSKWENETTMPDISQIVPLSRVFGVTTDALFGVYGSKDDDDVQKIIDEVERLGDDTETLKEQYEILGSAIKQYPNNVRILKYALDVGTTVVYCKIADNMDSMIAECERIGRILINNSGDPDKISEAHANLASMYNSLGQYERAREHIEKLPNTIMLRSMKLRDYYSLSGNEKEVLASDSSMFFRFINIVVTRKMTDIAFDYYKAGQYENAAVCYKASLDMIRGIFGEIPPYLNVVTEIIGLSKTYVKMGKTENAIETLEILPGYAEEQKNIKIGDEISDHPLIKPAECRYYDPYDKDGIRKDCLKMLMGAEFDQIKNDPRYLKIVEKLEA